MPSFLYVFKNCDKNCMCVIEIFGIIWYRVTMVYTLRNVNGVESLTAGPTSSVRVHAMCCYIYNWNIVVFDVKQLISLTLTHLYRQNNVVLLPQSIAFHVNPKFQMLTIMAPNFYMYLIQCILHILYNYRWSQLMTMMTTSGIDWPTL